MCDKKHKNVNVAITFLHLCDVQREAISMNFVGWWSEKFFANSEKKEKKLHFSDMTSRVYLSQVFRDFSLEKKVTSNVNIVRGDLYCEGLAVAHLHKLKISNFCLVN